MRAGWSGFPAEDLAGRLAGGGQGTGLASCGTGDLPRGERVATIRLPRGLGWTSPQEGSGVRASVGCRSPELPRGEAGQGVAGWSMGGASPRGRLRRPVPPADLPGGEDPAVVPPRSTFPWRRLRPAPLDLPCGEGSAPCPHDLPHGEGSGPGPPRYLPRGEDRPGQPGIAPPPRARCGVSPHKPLLANHRRSTPRPRTVPGKARIPPQSPDERAFNCSAKTSRGARLRNLSV